MIHQKWFRALFRRRVFIIILLLLQIAVLVYAFAGSSLFAELVAPVMYVVSFFIALNILTKKEKGAFKLTWIFLILLMPVFGGFLYLLCHFQYSTKRFSKKVEQSVQNTQPLFLQGGDTFPLAENDAPEHIAQIRYLQKCAGYPVYDGTSAKYLTPGEVKFACLLEELKKAERYIFLEYFIIQEGVMWNAILDILKEKAAAGVKVRLLYDDMGCFFLLPKDYPAQLAQFGIECSIFNPFTPLLSVIQNNRDHRKIAVIDGKTAFTGGINLADEYINAYEKHGHWKDAAVMLKGKAAWSLTLMFLQMWSLDHGAEDYLAWYPRTDAECGAVSDGLVQPYADSPMDRENVGEHVYLQMINTAKHYLYINTPYLIIDDSMVSALTLAAKSGVDVRIVTPHKWDKWFVHFTTRSFYRELINAGIKVYEYTDGFMHAKTFVADDTTATVGTTNLDFRSLYLHFECGVWFYKNRAVMEVKRDFLKTLERCHLITPADCRDTFIKRFFQDAFRLFAPLM